MRTFQLIALTSSNEHDPNSGTNSRECEHGNARIARYFHGDKTNTGRHNYLAIRELQAQK